MTTATGRSPARKVSWKLGAVLAVATAAAVTGAAGQAAAGTAVRAAPGNATGRIQSLLDHPVSGRVDLPPGTFTISPSLRLHQGEQIRGHGTTLKVASGSGDYAAVLSGVTPQTDLSGLRISGITFDQNSAGNPLRSSGALLHGQPRFVILVSSGSSITISSNRLIGTDGMDAIVTGSATSNVTISRNVIRAGDPLGHDQSSIYTSGRDTRIQGNTLSGTSMFGSAGIEVHGSSVTVTGNKVSGYPRGANIVASHTAFTGNTVTGALNPVDLWSVTAPGLTGVQVTGNTLGRDLGYWKRVYAARGRAFPAAMYTQMVIRDGSSAQPFRAIVVRGNRG